MLDQAAALQWLSPMCAVLGGCTAEVATSPVEIVKVRMQVSTHSPSASSVIASVLKTNGLTGFWVGLKPCLLRQVLCCSSKFACYEPFKRATYAFTPPGTLQSGSKPALWQMMVSGGAAGAVMGLVACPADLLKTRYS
jgi:Mitochondrial carrier protein